MILHFFLYFVEIENIRKEIQQLAEKRGEDFTEDTTGTVVVVGDDS